MKYTPKFRSRQTLVALMAIAATCPLVQAGEAGLAGGARGQGGGAGTRGAYAESDIVRRAMARRQEQTVEAMDSLKNGRELYNEGKYEEAKVEFEKALSLLPNAPMTADRRAFVIEHVADANIALAMEYRKTGRYDEARKLLDDVLKVDPGNRLAMRELDYLNDPVRTNPALTPQYVANVKQVNADLRMGNGFYELGEYDKADDQFDKVLRIDPYNVAARRFKERINNVKMEYYSAAYDQTRANMLMQVMQAWETPVHSDVVEIPSATVSSRSQDMGGAAILSKLRNTRISVNFENVSLDEAVDFLRARSRQLAMGSEGDRGINFVIRGGDGGSALKDLRVRELKLNNVPMLEVLKFLTESLGLRYKIDNYAVIITSSGAGDKDADMFTRTFKVSPSFRKGLETMVGGGGEGASAAPDDPFATAGSGGSSKPPRMGVQEMLQKQGVSFGEGSSCVFIPQSQTLIVKNTASSLDQIETIVDQILSEVPQMVTIQTKFVEVSQENTEELSFDWVLGATNLGGGNWMGGGVNGNGTPDRLGGDFNTIPGVPGTNVNPLTPTTPVNGIVTSGNRTGDGAITRDTVTGLLNNPNRQQSTKAPAPGLLSFTGIYNDMSFQVMMRGLSQKRGVDLLTAPSITSGKSGSTAKIEIIREFFYPESYLPPEIPNNVGNNNQQPAGGGGGGIIGNPAQVQAFPVTPATPEAFVSKELGITLEITPEYAPDSDIIELKFIPSIVEFEGFINYGSPIQAAAIDGLGNPTTVTITENRIEQPVFSRRRVEADLTIYDGHTVGIGGLISENVQRVEDKVPILGDLPFVGRLFRSEADNHVKTNLIIFVTAKKIDATGRPVSKAAASSTLPEAVAPTELPGAGGAEAGLLPEIQ